MTQAEIAKAKDEFILKRQDKLLAGATALEKKLFKKIVEKFVEKLIVDNGIITSNNKPISITRALDKLFDEFKSQLQLVSNQVQTDFTKILSFNGSYFKGFETDGKRYKKITDSVYEQMRDRVGIDEKGEFKRGGFLDQLIQDNQLRAEVKNATIKAVTGGAKFSDFLKSTEVLIQGSENVDGSLTKYYKGFAYDAYQQFDRATNIAFAKKLGLTVFVYSGGLIDDSRDFCIKKNRKVFTIDEAMAAWPEDKDLLKTKAEKEAGTLADYQPLLDMGRWNCRHTPMYIGEREALRRRPDLKSYFEAKKTK